MSRAGVAENLIGMPWTRYQKRANYFDFIRLVLAFLVIFSHWFALPGIEAFEPIK